MSKPNLTIQARMATPTTAILDIHGEVTGFGETALMDAYTPVSYTHLTLPTIYSV